MTDTVYELVFMPYLGMRGTREVSFGPVSVWNHNAAADYIATDAVRDRVKLLLGMYRQVGRNPAKAEPLGDIGVLAVGPADQLPVDRKDVLALQRALFLCCLAHNARLHGPNAGHSVFTSENLDIVRQTFTLGGEYISEQAGTIVSMNLMGYKIAETVFSSPPHVPRPMRFAYDEALLAQLARLRRANPRLLRRILEAAEVFRSSYYNAPTLGISARVLLQAAAFEVLFDLPEKEQRRVFKDTVERLLNLQGERKLRYKYEVYGTKKPDSRSLKGIWADRFYTLRNHLIHGETIRTKEYVFRGVQHHLVIAPLVFSVCVKKLISEWSVASGSGVTSDDKLVWATPAAARQEWDDDEAGGFRVIPDWGGAVRRAIARVHGRRTTAA